MRITKFEEIIAWQKGEELSALIYKKFSVHRDFGFRDQIQRASVSIMSNIAEGFERGSNPDFKKFLFISKGSCGEVRSLLYIAKDLKYISDTEFKNWYDITMQIGRLLSAFIKTL